MRIPYVTENTIDVASDVNGSLLVSDGLITSRVESLLTEPPASPTDGMRIGVKTGATGAFANKGGMLAVYVSEGNFWNFFAPILCANADTLYLSSGGDWKTLATAT